MPVQGAARGAASMIVYLPDVPWLFAVCGFSARAAVMDRLPARIKFLPLRRSRLSAGYTTRWFTNTPGVCTMSGSMCVSSSSPTSQMVILAALAVMLLKLRVAPW